MIPNTWIIWKVIHIPAAHTNSVHWIHMIYLSFSAIYWKESDKSMWPAWSCHLKFKNNMSIVYWSTHLAAIFYKCKFFNRIKLTYFQFDYATIKLHLYYDIGYRNNRHIFFKTKLLSTILNSTSDIVHDYGLLIYLAHHKQKTVK